MIFDLKNESDVDLVNIAIKGKVVGITSGSYDLFYHLHLVYLKWQVPQKLINQDIPSCADFCELAWLYNIG